MNIDKVIQDCLNIVREYDKWGKELAGQSFL